MKYLLLFILLLTSSAFAKAQALESAAPVLQQLHIGQKVTLSDMGGMYKIDILDDGAVGTYQITDLTYSYIALVDIVGMTNIRIPITSISAVLVTSTKKITNH